MNYIKVMVYKIQMFLWIQTFLMAIFYVQTYDLKCPESISLLYRAKFICSKPRQYTCLYNENQDTFVEFCIDEKTLPEGHKAVIRDNIDIEKCSSQRFQPIYFSTFGQSKCMFTKSGCREQGQKVYSYGTPTTDLTCFCNDELGFEFVNHLASNFCTPFQEDCTCFKRISKLDTEGNDSDIMRLTSFDILGDRDPVGVIQKYYYRNYCFYFVTGFGIALFILLIVSVILLTTEVQDSYFLQDHILKALTCTWLSLRRDSFKEEVTELKEIKHSSNSTRSLKDSRLPTPDRKMKSLNERDDAKKKPVFDGRNKKYREVIPINIQENIKNMMKQWELEDDMFATTHVSKILQERIEIGNNIIVTGSPGTGKSFTIRHLSLIMKQNGYDIIPVASSSEIVRYFCRNTLQMFFIDDLCGRYSISNFAIEEWERNESLLLDVFSNSKTRCIFGCRLQIYQDVSFKSLSLPDFYVVNLSDSYQYTLQENVAIAKKHIESTLECVNEETITDSPCFPLMCSRYRNEADKLMSLSEIRRAFFEDELNHLMQNQNKLKYSCIALCVLLNNDIPLDIFQQMTDCNTLHILMSMFEELGMSVTTPRKLLQTSLDSLIGSYLKFSKNGYESLNDHLFDIFCSHVGTTMIDCVVKCGNSKLISERAVFQSIGENEHSKINIPIELEYVFFSRIPQDIACLKILDVFGSYQMKYKPYRSKFVAIVAGLDFQINIFDEYGNSPLSTASQRGYYDVVEMLCKKGASVNTWIDKSSLHEASSRGHTQCVSVLLRYGANVNQCVSSGFSPLYFAAQNGHTDIVKVLCSKGADVNLCSMNGVSPLYMACSKGDINIVKLLINNSADVNLSDSIGRSPLYVASSIGCYDIVNILLEMGADVNQCTKNDMSCIFTAAQKGYAEIIEKLLNYGGDVNKCNMFEESPLYAASFYGHKKCVDFLLKNAADLNHQNKYMASPLYVAAHQGNSDILLLLLDNFASLSLNTYHEESPLFAASAQGHIKCVEILLNKGAVVNHCNNDGASPLYAAAEGGHIDVIKILYKYGADITLCTKTGMSPLNVADLRRHRQCVIFLLRVETKKV